MTPICNDQLTRVRNPIWMNGCQLPATYRVGDVGDKNGLPYTVKAFGTYIKHAWRFDEEKPTVVYLIIKYRGSRTHKWDCLLIGDTACFQEKIVLGGIHTNPVFTHYWPANMPQPL